MKQMCAFEEFSRNPIVYHVLTDRYHSSSEDIDLRPLDGENVGQYLGGDFRGVTEMIKSGWFNDLGINAILLSPPYEQVHGWVPSSDGGFKHFAYHGYFALDFTVVNPLFGTETDFADLVDTAHAWGLRVIIDVVMNHPGYADLQTLADLNIPVLKMGWESATCVDYHNYIDYQSQGFEHWWGKDWVRAELPGYDVGGDDEYTRQIHSLPDFKTESKAQVLPPDFLLNKLNSRVSCLPESTVRGYLINWLIGWVERFGVDGFRCDSVRHVEPDAWLELRFAAEKARQCRARAAGHNIDSCGPHFWMLGEVYGHGFSAGTFHDFGFNSVLNFQFQSEVQTGVSIAKIYQDYSMAAVGHSESIAVSYISSHDTFLFDRTDLILAGTKLLLCPGGVLMFYGDETARAPTLLDGVSVAESTRSAMNWNSIDDVVLQHWRKVGQFRSRHMAIACGVHRVLSDCPYIFSRFDVESGDRAIMAIDAFGLLEINVVGLFAEGAKLVDAYTGAQVSVMHGKVEVSAKGVVLLEQLLGSQTLTD